MNLSRPLTCMAILLALIAVSGCGSDDGGASPDAAGTATAAEKPGVKTAAAQVEAAKRIPEFSPPGPAFDATGVAGKTIFNIPLSSANAFITEVDAGARDAAEKADLRWIQYENQGSPTEWAQGMEMAIRRKVDLILLTAVDPSRIVAQIRAADKAGIPVVNVHAVVEGQEPANAPVSAWTYGPFLEAARLEADWVIADSGGDAEVLLLTTDEFPPSKPQREVMEEEFAKLCPDCKVTVVNVAAAEWGTKLVTETQSYLTAHPNADYIIPFYDSMAPFVESAIKTAGKIGKVKVVTYNGTPAVLTLIQNGDVVAMDVGENPKAIGYLGMDQVLRVLSGEQPAKGSTNAVRVFDDSNVDEAGDPPKLGVGYGSAEERLLELWGLQDTGE